MAHPERFCPECGTLVSAGAQDDHAKLYRHKEVDWSKAEPGEAMLTPGGFWVPKRRPRSRQAKSRRL